MQLGIVSTGAAFAVLVRDKKVGEDITIGTGTAFWLMCSMVAFLAGAFLCVVAVLRRRVRGRPRWVGYLGLDEVVASPSPSPDGQDGTRDVEQGQGAGDLARRSNSSRVPRPERTVSSEGHREGGESILSASTQTQFRNTVWIALYQQPEHLKEYILRLENSVRNCELLNLENSDIGVQPLVPTPLGSGEGIAQPESPSQTAVSLASEGGGGVRGRREQCDSILASQSASMLPLPRLRSNVRVPAKGFVDIDLAGETLVANQSPRESQYSNTSDTASLSLGTEISPYSPLEDLARDLNERQVLEMGANERSVYIAQRRVRSEERGRRVRLSLEGPKSRNGGLLERRLTVERQGKREIRVGDEVGLGGEVEVEMVHLNGDGRARSSSSGRSEGWKSSGDGNGNEEKNGVRDVKTIGRGRETRAGSNVERLKKMWEAVDECFDDNDNGNGAARYAREKVGIKGRRNLKHITLSDELRLESL
jgi:hypothetical protein